MALPERYREAFLPDKDKYTEEEYFAFEEQVQGRWQYVNEQIHAMSGGTPDHSAIAANLIFSLTAGLKAVRNQTCRVFTSDLKIHTTDGMNTYPDASVICGQTQLYRSRRDTVLNPLLLAEVLSPSTQAFDRGGKWTSYQTIPSLHYYLLLSVSQPRVELYTREEQGWHFEAVEGLEASLVLPLLNVTLALSDLYERVEFAEEPPLTVLYPPEVDGGGL
jgi:Uma2 family endonuclease